VTRSIVALLVSGLAGMVLATARAEAASTWSYSHLVQRIDGRTIRIGAARYKIDRSLVLCNGVGRPIVVRGIRRWGRFTCTQAAFGNQTIRDVTFGVRVLDASRCRFVNVRYGP
jgi:hypothetical protein